jgi:hypothetical protein
MFSPFRKENNFFHYKDHTVNPAKKCMMPLELRFTGSNLAEDDEF